MIKNYTSTVPVDRTISRIEALLVKVGASNIMKDYNNGELHSVSFKIPANNRMVLIQLPANVDSVYGVMKKAVKRPRAGTMENLRDQAARTAWKLMQDWLEVQISLIQMEQAEFLQVFLPYVWDGHRTFYHALKEGGFKQLTEGGGK